MRFIYEHYSFQIELLIDNGTKRPFHHIIVSNNMKRYIEKIKISMYINKIIVSQY